MDISTASSKANSVSTVLHPSSQEHQVPPLPAPLGAGYATLYNTQSLPCLTEQSQDYKPDVEATTKSYLDCLISSLEKGGFIPLETASRLRQTLTEQTRVPAWIAPRNTVTSSQLQSTSPVPQPPPQRQPHIIARSGDFNTVFEWVIHALKQHCKISEEDIGNVTQNYLLSLISNVETEGYLQPGLALRLRRTLTEEPRVPTFPASSLSVRPVNVIASHSQARNLLSGTDNSPLSPQHVFSVTSLHSDNPQQQSLPRSQQARPVHGICSKNLSGVYAAERDHESLHSSLRNTSAGFSTGTSTQNGSSASCDGLQGG